MDTTNTLFQRFNRGCKHNLLHSTTTGDGTNVSVVALLYHVSLYVNPESDSVSMVYEHRYCYASLEAAIAAIQLYDLTGEWMLWQKDHCRQISVSNGYLYPPGVYHSPENAIGMAGWNEKHVAAGRYETYHLELSPSRDRVWIHCSDGSTVGRFGKMGIDLHTSATEQFNGASECRLCTHEPVNHQDWALFREKVREWWAVDVPEDAVCEQTLSGLKNTSDKLGSVCNKL